MVRLVTFIVLMVLWLLFGCYIIYDSGRGLVGLSGLIPWACVAILGYEIYKGR